MLKMLQCTGSMPQGSKLARMVVTSAVCQSTSETFQHIWNSRPENHRKSWNIVENPDSKASSTMLKDVERC